MNSLVIPIILCSLATFRLTELIVWDYGPFDIFLKIRNWSQGSPESEERVGPIRSTFRDIITCVHCTSLWISILGGVLYFLINSGTDPIILTISVLAVAGLTSIILNKLGRR